MTDEELAVMQAENRARDADEMRIQRWHATYNAALTGMLARGCDGKDDWQPDVAHPLAVEHANEAHGPLVKP